MNESQEQGSIEIETSTDSVEDVQKALGEGVEIEESPAADEGAGSETPAGEEGEQAPAEPPAGDEGEGAGEGDEPPVEEEAEEPNPATDDKGKPVIPKARLDAEINKRKQVERELEDLKSRQPQPPAEPEPEPVQEPVKAFEEAEPNLDDYLKDVDDMDPKATAKATEKYVKAHHEWSGKKLTHDAQVRAEQQRAADAREQAMKPFRESEKDVLTRHPDYRAKVNASKVQVSEYMLSFVHTSPVGADLLIHFVDTPADANRIRKLPIADQSEAMIELQKTIRAAITPPKKSEDTTQPNGKEKTVVPPKKPTATPNASSKAPEPAKRIKTGNPQPKTMEELAGPSDRTGVDIEYSPEYEEAYKKGRR